MDLEDLDHECIQALINNSHEWTLEVVAIIMEDQDEMVQVILWEDLDLDKECEEEVLAHEELFHHHNFWIKD